MTDVDTDTLAERLAAQGREELFDRYREAFARAAGTHADVIHFDDGQLEAMVQRAAESADGLQWRRAIAAVAARELDLNLSSALTHPAVSRAHQLSGAPSYESALADLALPVPPPTVPPAPAPPQVPAPQAASPQVTPAPWQIGTAPTAPPVTAIPASSIPAAAPAPEASPGASAPEEAEDGTVGAELEREAAADAVVDRPAESADGGEVPVAPELAQGEAEPTPEPAGADAPLDQPTMMYDVTEDLPAPLPGLEEDGAAAEEARLTQRAEEFAQEFLADGVSEEEFTYEHEVVTGEAPAPLPDGEVVEFAAVHLGGVAALSDDAEIRIRLSIEGLDLLRADGDIVGRLGWSDMSELEVSGPTGRRRRRGGPRLAVHTAGGSARFEVPGMGETELEGQVRPLVARYGRRG